METLPLSNLHGSGKPGSRNGPDMPWHFLGSRPGFGCGFGSGLSDGFGSGFSDGFGDGDGDGSGSGAGATHFPGPSDETGDDSAVAANSKASEKKELRILE